MNSQAINLQSLIKHELGELNHLKPKIGFHVCIPLYHGIPKAMQTGWTRMGEHGVQEWDNTTDIQPLLDVLEHPEQFDRNLYCGTCGRIMVNGRNQTINPIADAKVIKLV